MPEYIVILRFTDEAPELHANPSRWDWNELISDTDDAVCLACVVIGDPK